MYKMNKVKSAEIFSFIQKIFETGGAARITVTGTSMYPFLRDGIDSVELSKTELKLIKRGDIVLAYHKTGEYVLHRIWKNDMDKFYMVGDAQTWIDGPYLPDQLIAAVLRIWRKDKEVSCNSALWRLFVVTWLILRPFRGKIFFVGRKIRKLIRKFF